MFHIYKKISIMVLVYSFIVLSVIAGILGLFLMFCGSKKSKKFKVVKKITFVVLGLDLLTVLLMMIFENSLNLL